MNQTSTNRIDEVEHYYQSPKKVDFVVTSLFWITAFISIAIPYLNSFGNNVQDFFKVIFILLVIAHFLSNIILSIYLIPVAERKRRRQLLSDAFDTPLTQEKTNLYYNNTFKPSVQKLAANIMENCLFSKEIASRMLLKMRWVVGVYMFVWVFIFAVRQSDLDLLLWITQLVFSSAIVMRWIQLEFLRNRHEQTYEVLYNYFLSGHQDNSKSIATILDAFASYEATKASAGLVLSTKVFEKINQEYTMKWQSIRSQLRMD